MEDIDLPSPNISSLYTKIFSDIPDFSNSNNLISHLNLMKIQSDDSIEEFKNILLDFTENLVSVSNNNLIKTYKTEILNAIKKHPKNIIDTFIIHGYTKNDGKYRSEIIQGNESFFLNNSYEEHIEGENNKQNIVNYIFQFKNFWKTLDEDNKFIIKNFLLTLCFFSDKRFVVFNRYNEIKNKYLSIHPSIFGSYNSSI